MKSISKSISKYINRIILLFYIILPIYFILNIINTLIKADLYSTHGFILFNSILFGSLVSILIYGIINTNLTLIKIES